MYTEIHFAYFRCIRAMFPAISMRVISNILLPIQHGQVDTAFWIVNEEQTKLHQEKAAAEQALKMLHHPELTNINNTKIKDEMTVGEAADLAGIEPSALRHWEKEIKTINLLFFFHLIRYESDALFQTICLHFHFLYPI